MTALEALPPPQRLDALRALAAMAVLAALGGLLWLLYTPTVTIHVRNDLAEEVTVSLCGSDPLTTGPGDTMDVDPNEGDAHAACIVYGRSGVLGCLPIPTTRLPAGANVQISDRLIRGVPTDRCGD